MNQFVLFLSYLLASAGLTVLIIWPERGPSAWLRERVVRPLIPRWFEEVLDCYICMSFWTGLALSPFFWWFSRQFWSWLGCLMVPALFWLVLHNATIGESESVGNMEDGEEPSD